MPSKVSTKSRALFFQALANPTRAAIISLLKEKGSMSVSEICDRLKLEQTMVSHHLKCLSFCGLVNSTNKSRLKIYSINEKTVTPLFRTVDQHLKKFARNVLSCDVLER